MIKSGLSVENELDEDRSGSRHTTEEATTVSQVRVQEEIWKRVLLMERIKASLESTSTFFVT
jgi:hypothetical protein